MGRLIDADAFIEYVNRRFDLCSDELRMMIEEQPTAYDVEKVVSELVQFGLNSMDKQIYDSDTYYDGVSVAIRKACNIVKRGGVE